MLKSVIIGLIASACFAKYGDPFTLDYPESSARREAIDAEAARFVELAKESGDEAIVVAALEYEREIVRRHGLADCSFGAETATLKDGKVVTTPAPKATGTRPADWAFYFARKLIGERPKVEKPADKPADPA